MSTTPNEEQCIQDTAQMKDANNQNDTNQQQQILNSLVQFYGRIRNPTSAQISNIQKQFVQCQRKVLKVVQFRKDIQSQQQIQQAKIEYMQKLQQVEQNYTQYEQIISKLVEQCHSKQSQILKLQTQLMKVQSSPAYIGSKFENYEGKSLNRIQQNIKQLKASVTNLVVQTKDGKYDQNKQGQKHNQVSLRKQRLKNKQILLQSKYSCLKFKQERISQSEQYNRKYMQALKQSVSAYEQMFIKSRDQQKDQQRTDEVRQSLRETKEKEDEYNKLCRAKLSQCQLLLMKIKQENSQIRNQLKRLTSENQKHSNQKQEKDVMIQEYRQMINQQEKQLKKQINIFQEKIVQLNKNNAHLTSENTIKDKLMEEIKTKCSNLQKQIHKSAKTEKKNINQLEKTKEQLNKFKNLKQQIEEKLTQVEDEKKSIQLINIQLKEQLQNVKKQINQSRQDLHKQQNKEQELKHNIDITSQHFQRQLKDNKQIISSLEKKLTAHQTKIKQLKKQLNQNKNAHEFEINNLNKKQRDLSKLVKQLTQQGAELRQENQKLVLSLNQKYIEIQNAHKQIKKLEKAIQQQIWRHKSKDSQRSKKIQVLSKRRENYSEVNQIEISEQNLHELKQQIQQRIQNQWMKNNKQIEQIILEICQMTKQINCIKN